MRELNNEEMMKISGGSASKFLIFAGLLGATLTFFIGVLDGYVNPKKCN